MPVIPSVTVTEETALSWQIGNDRFQKSVNAGTWTFPELELAHGENSIEIITDGTVTFRYREGTLMSIFRVFVDDRLFYHPQLSQLAITKAQVQEGVENIDSLTLSAPFTIRTFR